MTSDDFWGDLNQLEELAQLANDVYFSFHRPCPQLLVEAPDAAVQKLLQVIESGNSSDRNHAQSILERVVHARIDVDDMRGPLVAKSLAEHLLPIDRDGALRAVITYHDYLRPTVEAALIQHGLTYHDLDQDPVTVLTQCLYKLDAEHHLKGALWLSLYRMNLAGVCVGAVFIGLREALGYVIAGHVESATETIDWIVDELPLARFDLPDDSDSTIGEMFLDIARQASGDAFVALKLKCLKQAISLITANNNLRAVCGLELARTYRRSGQLADAIRCLEDSQRIPNVTDETIVVLLDAELSELEVALSADPTRIKFKEADRHVSRSTLFNILSEVATCLSDSREVPDATIVELSTRLRDFLDGPFGKNLDPTPALVARSELLAVLMSIHDASKRPYSLAGTVRESDAFFDQASNEARLRYKSLREAALALEVVYSRKSQESAENDSSNPSEVLEGRLRQIGSLESPEARLEALHTACLSWLTATMPQEIVLPKHLIEALSLTTRAARSIIETGNTPESTSLHRELIDDLLKIFNFFVLNIFAKSESSPTAEVSSHISLPNLDSESNHLLIAYREFLTCCLGWLSKGYYLFPLAQCTSFLTFMEKQEWAVLSSELASLLMTSFEDPLFQLTVANPKSPIGETIRRLRRLRTLAFAEATTRHTDPPYQAFPEQLTASESRLFFMDFAPPINKQSLYGIACFQEDRVHFWASPRWSMLVSKYQQFATLPIGLQKDRDIQETLAELSIEPTFRFQHWIQDINCSNASKSGRVYVADCTQSRLPLQVACDPQLQYRFHYGPPASHALAIRFPAKISFWGCFDIQNSNQIQIDEQCRSVHIVDNDRILCSSTFPSLELASLDLPAAIPSLLLFSLYEKWSLLDITRATSSKLTIHDLATSNRNQFLSHDWSWPTILHLTTHGLAYAEYPEAANVCLASEGELPTRIHFVDILSRDWRHLDLVFLNACVTQYGQNSSGEETLSLAWAFLAGGARAVIAHRWYVPDDVAWYFSHCFYNYLFCEQQETSLRDAFHNALCDTKANKNLSRDWSWGSFVLLENPARDICKSSELTKRCESSSNPIASLNESAKVRRTIRLMFEINGGLRSLSNCWKARILDDILANSDALIGNYICNRLAIIQKYVEPPRSRAFGDRSNDMMAICRELMNDVLCRLRERNPFLTLDQFVTDPSCWLRVAHETLKRGQYIEAAYYAAHFLASPSLDGSTNTNSEREAVAIIIDYSNGVRYFKGLHWINPNYVCHETTCPACGKGSRFGSSWYEIELRAYFVGEPENSINRRLCTMRIKCDDECCVGTDNTSGLYLVRDGKCVNWSRQKTYAFLVQAGSPLAWKFADLGEFDVSGGSLGEHCGL